MKKFFRSLAVLLALVLVIGAIPASAAEKTVKEAKTLYVDGTKGFYTDDDGNKVESSYAYRASISGLAGYSKKAARAARAEGVKFSAELVEGSGVVEIGKYYVKALDLGTAIVALYVGTDKVGESTITVKKSADDEIALVAEFEDGAEVIVGKEYEITAPRAGKDTDARRLLVNGKEVAEESARTWKFVAPKAGEYTITAEAFQSAKYNGTTGTASIKVKAVNAAMTEIAQKTKNVINVYFEYPMTEISAADFSIYTTTALGNKLADKKVKAAAWNNEQGCAVVEVYEAFVGGTAYTVAVGDDKLVLTGAVDDVKNIASFEITSNSVLAGGFRTLEYKFYNADGMEMTAPSATVKVIKVSGSDYSLASNNTLYLKNAGDSAVVKAEVVVNGKTLTADEKTIVGIKAMEDVVIEDATISASSVALTGEDLDPTKKAAVLTFKKNVDAYLHVRTSQLNNSTGKKEYAELTLGSTYRLTSNSMTVAVINGANQIVPVKEGTATIILEKNVAKAGEAAKWEAQTVYDVVILAAPKYDHYVVDAADLKVNVAATADEVYRYATARITVYDQYGDKFDSPLANTEFNAKDASEVDFYDVDIDDVDTGVYDVKFEFAVNAVAVDALKTSIITFKHENVESDIYVSVANYAAGKDQNVLTVTGGKTIDLSLTPDTKLGESEPYAAIKLTESCGNFGITDIEIETIIDKVPEVKDTTWGGVQYVAYVVGPDGKITGDSFVGLYDGVLRIAGFTTSSMVLTGKIKAGTYTVTIYKLYDDGPLGCFANLGTATVNVVDNQVKPELVQKADTTAAANPAAVVDEAFDVYFNGEKVAFDVTNVQGAQDASSKAWVITAAKATLVTKDGYSISLDCLGVPAVVYGK